MAALARSTRGKHRVRVARVHRDGKSHEVRESAVRAMVTGGSGRAFAHAGDMLEVLAGT